MYVGRCLHGDDRDTYIAGTAGGVREVMRRGLELWMSSAGRRCCPASCTL